MSNPSLNNRPKAVGLISGGLDSMIAARLLKNLGVEVYGFYFALPWGCGNSQRAESAARQIGIPLRIADADQSFLQMLQNPRHGYGSAINPCVDCHIHMIKLAAEYMREIKADFVFTGEVLGQRPMSQLKNSLRLVEKNCGLEGRLLRPLCAKLLEPALPEKEGRIDREKLLAISGRGRKEQIALAKEFGFTDYPNPAGGCLLTDKNFANRLRDAFSHGTTAIDDTVILKWGRHFRLNESFKVIVARDEEECDALFRNARQADHILQFEDNRGPLTILQGENPEENVLRIAAGLAQHFSRYRGQSAPIIRAFPKATPQTISKIFAARLTEKEVEGMWL